MVNVRLNVQLDQAGIGRFIERVRKVDASARAAQTPAAQAMAEETLKYMERKIREPKSGEQHAGYPRPSGISPGYPAHQWGGLVGSFYVHTTIGGNATLGVGRSLSRDYAYYLEYGWPKRPQGFPFIRPSVEAMTPYYREIVQNVVRKYIR